MSSRGCAGANPRAHWAPLSLIAYLVIGAGQACADEELTLRPASEIAAAHFENEQLILDVFINGQRRGEFTVYRDAAGAYYLRTIDASALGLTEAADTPK